MTIFPDPTNSMTCAAVLLPSTTLSLTSVGPSTTPAAKIPDRCVETGSSFGCFSETKPSSPRGTFSIFASCSVPFEGTIAVQSTTVSNSFSIISPSVTSSARTMIPVSPFWMSETFPWMYLTPNSSIERT